MNVAARRYANALVLRVHGRLDQDTCEDFRVELLPLIDRVAREKAILVLDLAELEYVSSAGLRCFLIASREMKAKDGRVVLAALQPMVAEIFAISHFDQVFQVYPTVPAALEATSREAAAAFAKG
jgi:anti-anti-sigma factor